MSGPVVDLIIETGEWDEALPSLGDDAEAAARLALEESGLDPGGWEVSLLACDDARIADLNREFRGKAEPTNVLSWPAFALAPARPGEPPPAPPQAPRGARQPLGDVAIALQTTRREAAASAIPLKDHAIHLILHGCLHLLGYDHETPEDAAVMEGMETRALARIGVADPYLQSDAGEPHPER